MPLHCVDGFTKVCRLVLSLNEMFWHASPLIDETRPWFVTAVPGGVTVTTTAAALAAVSPNTAVVAMCLIKDLYKTVSSHEYLALGKFQA
jgi:hypothetical protein